MDKHKYFFCLLPIFNLCVCLGKQFFFFPTVNFCEHLACIGKHAIKLCRLLYFWPIHLPIFIPCLVLFRLHYCFIKTLSLTIPADKISFLLYSPFSNIIWDHMHLPLSNNWQEIQCQNLYWKPHYFYLFSISAVYFLPLSRVCVKASIIKQDLNLKNIFTHYYLFLGISCFLLFCVLPSVFKISEVKKPKR